MLKRIVFIIQLLFVLGMSLLIGTFLAYIQSLFVDFALGLKIHDSTAMVFLFLLPFFVVLFGEVLSE